MKEVEIKQCDHCGDACVELHEVYMLDSDGVKIEPEENEDWCTFCYENTAQLS